MGFDAGDSNLYRYVNNSPVNGVDPSGNELFALSFNAASRARQSLDSYGIKTAIYQLPASRGAEGTSPDLYRPIPNLPADAQKGYLYYLTPTNGLPGTAPNFGTDGYAKNLYNGLKSYTFHTLTYATGGVPQKFWSQSNWDYKKLFGTNNEFYAFDRVIIYLLNVRNYGKTEADKGLKPDPWDIQELGEYLQKNKEKGFFKLLSDLHLGGVALPGSEGQVAILPLEVAKVLAPLGLVEGSRIARHPATPVVGPPSPNPTWKYRIGVGVVVHFVQLMALINMGNRLVAANQVGTSTFNFLTELEAEHQRNRVRIDTERQNPEEGCRPGYVRMPTMPSDQQLTSDAKLISMFYSLDDRKNREAMSNRTVAVAVITDPQNPECKKKIFAVSSNLSTPLTVAVARLRGYTLVEPRTVVPGSHTHAELLLVDYLRQDNLINPRFEIPIPPSRQACDVAGNRNNQHCAAIIGAIRGLRYVDPGPE